MPSLVCSGHFHQHSLTSFLRFKGHVSFSYYHNRSEAIFTKGRPTIVYRQSSNVKRWKCLNWWECGTIKFRFVKQTSMRSLNFRKNAQLSRRLLEATLKLLWFLTYSRVTRGSTTSYRLFNSLKIFMFSRSDVCQKSVIACTFSSLCNSSTFLFLFFGEVGYLAYSWTCHWRIKRWCCSAEITEQVWSMTVIFSLPSHSYASR